jgi:hypothetical protein
MFSEIENAFDRFDLLLLSCRAVCHMLRVIKAVTVTDWSIVGTPVVHQPKTPLRVPSARTFAVRSNSVVNFV